LIIVKNEVLSLKKISIIKTITGRIIKERRIRQGISQEDLAGICEVDRSYISQLERGLNEPSISKMFDLCEGLKMKPSDFIKLVEIEYNSRD
jgi:transcriptional regulator with XRE-family HTH domain